MALPFNREYLDLLWAGGDLSSEPPLEVPAEELMSVPPPPLPSGALLESYDVPEWRDVSHPGIEARAWEEDFYGRLASPGGEEAHEAGHGMFVEPLLNIAASAPGLMARSFARRGGGELPPLTPDEERAALDAALMGVAGPVGRAGGKAWRWLTQTPGLTRPVPGGWRTAAGGPAHGPAPVAPVARSRADKLYDMAADPRTPAHEAASARSMYERLTGEPGPVRPVEAPPAAYETLAAEPAAAPKSARVGMREAYAKARPEVVAPEKPRAGLTAEDRSEMGSLARELEISPSYAPIPFNWYGTRPAFEHRGLFEVPDYTPEAKEFRDRLVAYEKASSDPLKGTLAEEIDLLDSLEKFRSIKAEHGPLKQRDPRSPDVRAAEYEVGRLKGLQPGEWVRPDEAEALVDRLGKYPDKPMAEDVSDDINKLRNYRRWLKRRHEDYERGVLEGDADLELSAKMEIGELGSWARVLADDVDRSLAVSPAERWLDLVDEVRLLRKQRNEMYGTGSGKEHIRRLVEMSDRIDLLEKRKEQAGSFFQDQPEPAAQDQLNLALKKRSEPSVADPQALPERAPAFSLLRGKETVLGPAEGLVPARDERIATNEPYTAADVNPFKPSSSTIGYDLQRWAASDDMIEKGRFDQAELSLIRQLKKQLMKYDPRIRGERELGWVLSGFKAHSLSLPLNSPQSKAANRFGRALNAYEDLGYEASDDALLSGSIDLLEAARGLERALAPTPAPATGRPALRAAYEAGKPEPVAPEPPPPTQTPAQTGAMESVPVEALESNESFREWIRSQSRGGNKEIIKKLQGELNDIRASQESAPGEVLYHGTGRHVADQIESEGFSLSTGRRSGPFGDTKEIQNQAVFLSPQKVVARSYGQNKYERDDVLLTAKVNAQKQLDFTDPSTIPSDLRKKALEVVREYEGPSVARLRQEDIHWLIDQQGFAQALRDRGYDSVRFLESSSTSKSLGLDRRGETVAVLDPAIISLEPKNRGGLAWSREQIMKGRSPSPPPPTQTPAFRRWFGESKVVDEKGEPMVVYHGTTAEFDQFDTSESLGAHFGTSKAANDRIRDMAGVPGRHAHVKPVFIRVERPYRLPDLDQWDQDEVLDFLDVDDSLDWSKWSGGSDGLRSDVEVGGDYEPIQEFLRRNGHDGIVYQNREEGVRYATSGERILDDSYIVFDPTQIKSATGNVGTYDPKDPRIAYGIAGAAAAADED